MRRSIQMFEHRLLKIWRVVQAIFYLVLGLVFIFGSFWLVAVFGSNIFVVGIDFVLLLNAWDVSLRAFMCTQRTLNLSVPISASVIWKAGLIHAGRRRDRSGQSG